MISSQSYQHFLSVLSVIGVFSVMPHTDYAQTKYCFTGIQSALANNGLLISSGINAELKTQVPQIKVDAVTMWLYNEPSQNCWLQSKNSVLHLVIYLVQDWVTTKCIKNTLIYISFQIPYNLLMSTNYSLKEHFNWRYQKTYWVILEDITVSFTFQIASIFKIRRTRSCQGYKHAT